MLRQTLRWLTYIPVPEIMGNYDYEGIPLKQMKKLEEISYNKKRNKIFKMFKFVVSF